MIAVIMKRAFSNEMGTLALGCFLLLPHAQAVAVAGLRQAARVSLAPPLPLPSRSLPPSLNLLDEPRSLDRSPSETKSPLPSPPPVSSGLLVLCLVPLAWGTYGPAIKALYALDAPPPELLFSVLNYCVSSSALLAVSSAINDPPSSPDKGGEDDSADNAATGPLALLSSPDVAAAGLELSAYLFVGSTVQAWRGREGGEKGGLRGVGMRLRALWQGGGLEGKGVADGEAVGVGRGGEGGGGVLVRISFSCNALSISAAGLLILRR